MATICELAFPLTAVILEYVTRENILHYVQWIGVAILFTSILRVSRLKPAAVNLEPDQFLSDKLFTSETKLLILRKSISGKVFEAIF